CESGAGGCELHWEESGPGVKGKSGQNTEPAPFAPGAGAPTVRGGGSFICRSTAPVRKRTLAKTPSQPHSHPGRVLLRCEVVAASFVGAPPRCESEVRPRHRASPIRTRGGCSYGARWWQLHL